MALAANALTTYAAVSGQAPGATQARLEAIINAVSAQIQRDLWPLGYSVITGEKYQGSAGCSLYLKRGYIRSVQVVRIDGTAVTDFLSTRQFLDRGELYREVGWPRKVNSYSDLTQDPDYLSAYYTIEVDYTAGWILPQYTNTVNATHNPSGAAADLPVDIQEAVNMAVVEFALRPNPGIVREKTPGGWDVQWSQSDSDRMRMHSARIGGLLNSYRTVWTV